MENMMNGDKMMGGKCGCMHHKMTGVFVMLIGAAFLLKEFGVLTEGFVNVAWPVLLIALGGKKMMSGMCKCCDGGKCSC